MFSKYKKSIIGVAGVLLFMVMVASWYFFVYTKKPTYHADALKTEEAVPVPADKQVVTPGSYSILQTDSKIAWSLGKPLIPEYINNGSFNLSEGLIVVGEGMASATFSVNMDTLQIGAITEEGKENTLKETLEGPHFFDVEKFPDAKFVLTEVVPQADSATTFLYRVKGMLTIKGETHEVMFTSKIYEEENKLWATAKFDIDRTLWGITASSSSFFEDLGNDAVGNIVSLSLSILAQKQ